MAKNRTKTGKFRKGHSGNPKGRPKKRKDSIDIPSSPDIVTYRSDGWASAITGIGTSTYDKRLGATFDADIVDYATAVALIRGDDIAAQAVEALPDDAMRSGYDLRIRGEDDISKVKDLQEQIEQRWEELFAYDALNRAAKFERGFGGGAILIGANDGQDLRRELDYKRISSVDYLTPLEPRELTPLYYYANPLAPKFGEIAIYRATPFAPGLGIDGQPSGDFEIHESRLVRFPGIRVNREYQNNNNGWGDSVLTRIWRVLRDFNQFWDSIGIIAADFSQSIFKMEGLATLLANDEDEVFRARMRALELGRSVARAAVLDVNEEFERKATPLTGIPELLDRYDQRMAAATGMPVTKLFGRSPAGMNATGESDTRNWYDTVDDWRERKIIPGLKLITKALLAEAGASPQSWDIEGCPLWQESEKERAETRKLVAEADEKYIAAGVVYPEEVAQSRWGGDGYSMEMSIDFDAREELEAEEEARAAEIEQRAAELAKEQATAPPNGASAEPGSKDQESKTDEAQRMDRIEKRGNQWVVLSSAGKVLGTHKTRKAAVEQLQAVEASKGRRK